MSQWKLVTHSYIYLVLSFQMYLTPLYGIISYRCWQQSLPSYNWLFFFFFKLDLFILDRLLHTLFRNEMFSLCMEFDRNEEKSHPFSSVVLTSYEGKHSQLSLVSCNAIIFLRGRLIPEKGTCWQGHLPSWLGTVMSGHWEYKYDLFKLLLSSLPLQTDS